MKGWFNRVLDRLSEYFARRKGLLPMVGLLLILGNFLIRLMLEAGFLVETDLLLHFGITLAILGFLLAWAL